MKPYRSLVLLLVLALMLPSASAAAFDDDEMTFEPDDVDWEDDDDDSMTFAPDDIDDEGFDPSADAEEALDVGVVTVPGDSITDRERDDIQSALRAAAREIPGITTYGESDLLPALIDRDPDYCSRESLCLASIGRASGVERILQARIEEQGGDYRLDIDYFDVDERLFVSYHTNTGLGGVDDLIEAIPAGVDDIFGLRRGPVDDDFVDVEDVNAMRIASYFAAGASVLSIGIGTIFGLRVSSTQSDIDDEPRDPDGRFENLTQREARAMRRDMESDARIANFGIGAGIGLAATSVLLFIVSSEDDPEGEDMEAGLRIAPQFDGDRFGIGASWRF